MSLLPCATLKLTNVHVFEAMSVLETTDAPGVLIGVAKRPVSAIDSDRSCRNQKHRRSV